MAKLTRLAIGVNNRRFDGRAPESPATFSNQGIFTQLSEQISTLNERMDEFTSRIEEMNSKFAARKVSASHQNLALQAEANGSGPTSHFVNDSSNGSLTGALLPNSSSSSQLAKESSLMEERQAMLQIDNLSNLLRDFLGERSRQGRMKGSSRSIDGDSITVPLLLTLGLGGLGVLLFRSLTRQK